MTSAFNFQTGTLTEDGLDMWGVIPTEHAQFRDVHHDAKMLGREQFLIGMATCHSLTIIENQISGDPLDYKMFEATGWVRRETTMHFPF